jgi:hypothetical protein
MSWQLKQLSKSFAGGEMSPEMYSRIDDPRFINGAALMRNMVCRPQGTVIRRPGSQFIRKARDNTLGKRVRLLPFNLPNNDTYAIEAGRAVTDGKEIGYFRFHTQGGTLLYDKPATYKPRILILSYNISTFTFTTSTAHNLQTGDPVTISYSAYSATGTGTSVTVPNVTKSAWTLAGSVTTLEHGQPIIVDHPTMPTYTQTTGGVGVTKTLERGKIYYVWKAPGNGLLGTDEFCISETQFGNYLPLASAGVGNGHITCPPFYVGGANTIFPSTTYYAKVDSPTTFRLSLTKAKALSTTIIPWTVVGTGYTGGGIAVHYAYQAGDFAYWTGASPGSFSCIRAPWGRVGDTAYSYYTDHLDHDPSTTTLNYWVRVSGAGGSDKRGREFSATVDDATDTITLSEAHNLDNGEPVVIYFSTSPAPGVISNGDVLYVRNGNGSDLEVSLTAFGEKVDLTAAGSGVTILLAPYYEVPHFYTEDDLLKLTVAQSNNTLSLACQSKPMAELQRTAAGRWDRSDVIFGSTLNPPTSVSCRRPNTTASLPNGVLGQSHQVTISQTGTTGSASAQLTTLTNHNFGKNEPVYVYGLSARGIPDGDYMTAGNTSTGTSLYLVTLGGANFVAASSTGGTGYVQPALAATDRVNTYVVTAIDSDGNESKASNEFEVSNNLYVEGANNPLAWTAVPNASRYRIYKKIDGLYGMIGDTEATNFTDDLISPDTSITPPRPDYSLLYSGSPDGWNTTLFVISWTGSNLEDGMAIVFETNGTMPLGMVENQTYWVINAGPDSFQISEDPYSGTVFEFTGVPTGQVYAKAGFFPGSVSYFEGRRCLAGSIGRSQDVWMTSSGTDSDLNYSLPTVDSDRIQFRIAAREASAVKHIIPLNNLLLLTNAHELRVTPINDDALTPTSVSVRPQSYVGCGYPQPAVVNNLVVFTAARGGHLRELGYSQDVNGYLTGDLSLRAAHLFDDYEITEIAYQKAPVPTIWTISSSGKLLGMTYLPDEQIGSWHQHDTDGVFESVVALAEGVEDVLYVCVRRGTTRYIERLSRSRVVDLEDCFYVDCGVTYDGTATTSIIGLEHLNGRTVNYLADGVAGTTVVSAGAITLPTAAQKVHVGIPLVAQLKTIPMAMQVDQSGGSGRQKNVNAVWVRVIESSQFRVGPSSSALVNSRAPAAGQMLSELVPVTLPGSWTDDGQVLFEANKATPLNITGITIEVAAGG